MARLLTCGWETGSLGELNGPVVGNVALTTDRPYTGKYALRLLGAATQTHEFDADQDVLFGRTVFRVNYVPSPTGEGPDSFMLLSFSDLTGAQWIGIWYDGDTATIGLRDMRSHIQVVGDVPIRLGYMHVLDWSLTIDATQGIFLTTVDGFSDCQFFGDTNPFTSGAMRCVTLCGPGGGASVDYDDLAINNGDGIYESSWPGTGRDSFHMPISDGDVQTWAPQWDTVPAWGEVNEIPADTATYIMADQTARSLFHIQPVVNPVITLVQVVYRAAIHISGSQAVTDMVRQDGVDYDGLTATITNIADAYQVFKGPPLYVQPNGGSAWTMDAVNALQIGVEILNNDLTALARVTQIGLYVEASPGPALTAASAWEMHIFSPRDQYMCWLDGATGKAYLEELNGAGHGEFRIHALDHKLQRPGSFTYGARRLADGTIAFGILCGGNVVRLRWRGRWIGAWVIEPTDGQIVAQDEIAGRVISVSGDGLMGRYLKKVIVYPGFLFYTDHPNHFMDPRSFGQSDQYHQVGDHEVAVPTPISKARIFKFLWNEAENRGVTRFHCNWTNDAQGNTFDTDGNPCTDSFVQSFSAGTTMFQVMQRLAAFGIDFRVMPGRPPTLNCYNHLDKSPAHKVTFRKGDNIIAPSDMQINNTDRATCVLAHGPGGGFETAHAIFADQVGAAESIYGREETFLEVESGTTYERLYQVAQLLLQLTNEPQPSIHLTVTTDKYAPFIDYNVGDTAKCFLYDPLTDVDASVGVDYRILSIAVHERAGPHDLVAELELNSRRAEYLIRLQKLLSSAMTTTGAVVDSGLGSPTFSATAAGGNAAPGYNGGGSPYTIGTLNDYDRTTHTATVTVGDTQYTGVGVNTAIGAWSMVIGSTVYIDSFNAANTLIVALYNAAPPANLFDPVSGHHHDKTIDGGGPISQKDIIP
jgi:hypothetical protein